VEVDAAGWPTIFASVLRKSPPLAKSRASSIASVGSVASTCAYDAEGFPIFAESEPEPAARAGKPNAYSPDDLDGLMPITPRGKKRKSEAKHVASTQKETRATSNRAHGGARVDVAELPIEEYRISGPTKEANPRLEVCGIVQGVRIHVFSTTRARWGPDFAQKGRALVALSKQRGYNKAQVLVERDRIDAKRGRS
jgi:hypothetical protein